MSVTVVCTVNGLPFDGTVDDRTLLSDWLRHEVGLTGTHVGCEHGVCGACTVIVDGRAVRACLMLAAQADGCVIETVESLGTAEKLNELQETFRNRHALQCGFCTAGILMSLTAAEREGLSLDDAAGEVLGGHLCRCTGYQNIRAAVEEHWSGSSTASSSAGKGEPA
jgi:aerobic-type carbon monoxide dehydrogenase small subunit (CoxS/CutS family)